MDFNDCIAHVITGREPSAVSVIRISGPGSFRVLKRVFSKKIDYGNIKRREIFYGRLTDENGETADEVLAAVMPAPRTFTGEDTVEIGCHGGVRTTGDCLALVLNNGARAAEPGEFTKRAFLNGRMDLSQAEAVADLVAAKTAYAKNLSLKQLSGALKTKIGGLREGMLNLLAHIEAGIDFPEDALETLTAADVVTRARAALAEVEALIQTAGYGQVAINGVTAVIAGKPNVGKSSLYNAILGAERAIVTDMPGTTRDVLSEEADIGGLALKLADTAGVREISAAMGQAERIGIVKTGEQIAGCDAVLWVTDGSAPLDGSDKIVAARLKGKNVIPVVNKSDLPGVVSDADVMEMADTPQPPVRVSAKNGTGLNALYDRIKEMCLSGVPEDRNEIIYKERHLQSLIKTKDALANCLSAAESGLSEEFLAIDLTAAYAALGEITGETAGEDVIDRIFSEFCLGK